MKNITLLPNKNIFKLKGYSFYNDEDLGFSLNVALNLLVTMTKLLVYVKFYMPEDSNDKNYRKEVLRTVGDAEKVIKFSHSNFIVKNIIKGFVESIDREIKFPLEKVHDKFD